MRLGDIRGPLQRIIDGARILKKQYLGWTVSSLKKALQKAWLLPIELESMTEEEIRIRILSKTPSESGDQ